MAVSLSATLNADHSTRIQGRQCKYTGQSVFLMRGQRALPIKILTVGRTRSQGVQLIVDDYIEKLKCYCRIEDVRIRSNPKNSRRDVKAQVEHEDMAVMHLIRSDDWVVMLDEHGLDIESEQMAELIGDAGNTVSRIKHPKHLKSRIKLRTSSLLFCIGGSYGHGRQLRQRANLSIKLSSLVLNHQIALVVLMEQLFRHGLFLEDKNTITRDISHGHNHIQA
ncbi:unnamed protein product [Camellia sinensis]